MVSIPAQSGFVIVGAASGQVFASQVGNIGLVGSFGGMALGTPVIVISGALAGAAVQGIIDGIESGDIKVLDLDQVLQELTWYQEFSDLDTDQELQAMKQRLKIGF